MRKLKLWMAGLFRDERGATATEYAIMIVLILLVAFATIIVLGNQIDNAFNRFVTDFEAAQGS